MNLNVESGTRYEDVNMLTTRLTPCGRHVFKLTTKLVIIITLRLEMQVKFLLIMQGIKKEKLKY